MSNRSRVSSLATIAVLIIATSAPATAAPGELDWSASYDGPAARKDRALAIVADPDDARVYVTGESRGDGLDYATIAYDGLTGEELWVARYEGPGQQDTASAIAMAPDGQTVVVTGSSWEFGDDADWATVAYDAETGDELWVRRMNSGATGHDHGRDVQVHGDRVLVTGENGDAALTQAYDLDSGALLWSSSFGPKGGADAYDVEASGRRAFVTGLRNTSRGANYLVLAYRVGTGRGLWNATFTGPVGSNDVARDAIVSLDGSSLFVTGTTELGNDGDGNTGNDLDETTTIALDVASGQVTWMRRLPAGLGGDQELPLIALDPDGGSVAVTTTAHPAGGTAAFLTRAYAAGGNRRWTALEDPDGTTGRPRGIAYAPDGDELYVGGVGSDDPGHEFGSLVAAYAADTGGPLWSAHVPPARRFDGSNGVAVGSDGERIFVTGTHARDYSSIAYLAR